MKQGIVNKHTYNQTLEAIKTQTLPINLHAAFNRYDDNEYLKNLLGKDIHQHFGAFYNFEFTEYMNQVDDWELNRYLFNI